MVVRHRHRVELADGVVALQDAARVLPGDGRAGLHLRPCDLRVRAAAVPALGHEVVDPALAVLVARVPVLHRRVLDRGAVERHEFDHRGVQLVLVAHRRRAPFEIADVRALVGDDQRALELPGLLRVDAEVRRELHRAAHALRHVAERSVAEHRGIQRRKEVVGVAGPPSRGTAAPGRGVRCTASENEQKMMPSARNLSLKVVATDTLSNTASTATPASASARRGECRASRTSSGISGSTSSRLVERLRPLRRRVVDDVLVVDGVVLDVRPVGLVQRQPGPVRLQPPVEHPAGLAFARRQSARRYPRSARAGRVRPRRRDKAVPVVACGEFLDGLRFRAHGASQAGCRDGIDNELAVNPGQIRQYDLLGLQYNTNRTKMVWYLW